MGPSSDEPLPPAEKPGSPPAHPSSRWYYLREDRGLPELSPGIPSGDKRLTSLGHLYSNANAGSFHKTQHAA